MPAHVPAVTTKRRDMAVLTMAHSCVAFALNFMFVFPPFCVHAVSPLDDAATHLWTRLIVGTASASPKNR